MVMTDNDKRFPDEAIQNTEELKAFCEREEITYIILTRRAIENYIPVDVLRQWAMGKDLDRAVTTFASLNNEQKRHFHLKEGFSHDSYQTNHLRIQEQEVLFANVAQDERQTLRNGFGSDLYKAFNELRDRFTRENLRDHCECNRQELYNLLIRIEQEV